MNLRYILLLLIGSLLCVTAPRAQIPNAGFENWTSGQPDGWLGFNTQQTSDAHSGSSAVMGQVGLNFPTVAAAIISGNNVANGFPYTARAGSFTGYYKFSPIAGSNDTLLFVAAFTTYNAASGNTDLLGYGEMKTSAAAGTYTQFTVPVQWLSSDFPDSAGCFVSTQASANGIGTAGTTFEVDEVSFGGASDVAAKSDPSFSLSESVPNPVSTGSKIKYSLAHDGVVTLTVFDETGRQIAVLASGYQTAGNHMAIFDGSSLHAGIYYYRLAGTDGSAGRCLQLIK